MDLVGSRLGKYELDTEIGQGDLGAVYKGQDPDVARSVAIKVLSSRQATRDDAERFLHTVRAAARLNHPNIVNIYDIGKSDDWFFYVMEYLDGQSLSELLLERGPLGTEEAQLLLRQMAAALDHAHAQGIVHGGVKPSNVIVVGREHVKVTDFGYERPVQPMGASGNGASINSLRYISPEQARGKTAGTESDLYSLAVIAYEMLAGEPPFDARSKSDILYRQVHETPPSLLSKRPDLSPAVDEVFDRALAKQPERRYWSGTTFVTSLVGALGDQTSAVVTGAATQKATITEQPGQEPSGPTPAKRSAWVWIAGGVLVLALILLGALVYSGVVGRSEPTPTFDVVALLTAVPNPISTMTPYAGSALASDTPPPEPTAAMTPTDSSPPIIGPGSLVTVKVPVADVRAQASRGSELVTQVIMGDKVMVQETGDGWYRIAAVDQPSPKDSQGYPGWIESGAVSPWVDEQDQLAIVIVPAAPVRATASDDGSVIHTLSFDSRLTLKSANDAWVAVALPDRKEGWVARDQVRLVCPDQGCTDDVAGEPDVPRPSDEIVETAQQFIGTRYLWGGTSASAFDCSGFIYRVFRANGITVPRDSLPMSQSGAWVEREDLQPGDIIFTANGGPSGRVSHCALYLGDGQVLTTVGTAPITIVPLDSGRYRDEYWGARRYP